MSIDIFPPQRELSGDGKYWKKEADKARSDSKQLREALEAVMDTISDQLISYRFGDELGKAKEALNNTK